MKSRPNYIVTILVVLVLALGSITLCEVVPNILRSSNAKTSDSPITFDVDSFANDLAVLNYLNAVELLSSKGERAADFFLDLSSIPKVDKELVKQTFETSIKEWIDLRNQYANLKYYAYEHSSKLSHSNNDVLATLLTNKEPTKELKDYQFLAIMEYSTSGSVTVDIIRGGDSNFFYDFLKDSSKSIQDNFVSNGRVDSESLYGDYVKEQGLSTDDEGNVVLTPEQYQRYQESTLIKPIKDMTFIYGIPKDISFNDNIGNIIYWQRQGELYPVKETTLMILLAAMLAAGVFALVVPYRYAKDGIVARVLLRFRSEVLIGLCFVAAYGVFGVKEYNAHKYYYPEGSLTNFSPSINSTIEISLKLAGFFLCLGAAYLVVVILKHIIHEGVFTYLKENSILFRCIRFVTSKIKKWYHCLTTLDFSEKAVRNILLLLGIHTLITIGLCCIWFIGIPFAILYNVLLAVFLIKKYNLIKAQYHCLMDSAKNITAGDLETSIDEELGVFNSIRDEINRLREGLQYAVEEEVKSQNMKAELITNVSHDLKTPLTSIITYVDLLKSDTLTEEERQQYIEILDQKSQRLKALIEGLFEVSKTNSKSIVLACQNLDLITLIKEVLVEYEDKLEKASLFVKTDYQEEKVVCYLDSEKTYRVFDNLFGNIVKYAMSNTRVYITVSKLEKEAEITIKNISDTEIKYQGDQLFERFVRGDMSRNTEGSGLGLAIAKGLTEVQGGTIGIEVDGDLFKVTVRFPLPRNEE